MVWKKYEKTWLELTEMLAKIDDNYLEESDKKPGELNVQITANHSKIVNIQKIESLRKENFQLTILSAFQEWTEVE